MTSFLLAIQFLTRYPVPLSPPVAYTPKRLGRATRYFPLVGLVVGLDLLFLRWLLEHFVLGASQPLLCAGLLLAYATWVADSLHLDGLADAADGLASGRRGEELLAVMHDPRTGAFGVQATVLALLLKFALLHAIKPGLWWALPLAPLFSRLLAALLCHVRPYAGRPGSLSGGFIAGCQPDDAGAALGWTFGAFTALAGVAVWQGWADGRTCAMALAAGLGSLLLGWAASRGLQRRLGGISGDVIGLAVVVCDLACLAGLILLRV